MVTVSFGGPLEFGVAGRATRSRATRRTTAFRPTQLSRRRSRRRRRCSRSPRSRHTTSRSSTFRRASFRPGMSGRRRSKEYIPRPAIPTGRRRCTCTRARSRRARRARGADVGGDAGRCGGDARNSRRHLGQSGRGRAARQPARWSMRARLSARSGGNSAHSPFPAPCSRTRRRCRTGSARFRPSRMAPSSIRPISAPCGSHSRSSQS